ncbi:serine/threonine protein kinase [Hyalangium sp.]|uniref:serine/threonine protein kinase n=1 Tax=Hyalangium sp. TaxID=2028555 RepID=UPI002D4F6464|nr:protein kinase [Hyalangium sp.]HYI02548.1 protein kinase [Hyalangium sp.]
MQHPFHLMPNMMVGPFRIQARLGAGGFGAVFRVECGGEQYALKFAAHGPDSDDANHTDARAQRELACLLLITHPNVVRVWAHGRWPHPRTGYHYVVMDYVEGPMLTDWVQQTRPALRQVIRLFDTLALALEALHAQAIHHRDLKGSNILVRARDGEPVLVDFGASEHAGSASPLTEGPLPPGTPHLRTPEALRFHREQYADPSARYPFQATDDLYALGATLYEVLTRAPPFPPTLPREVLTSLIETEMPASPAVLNPQVPPALADLVLRLLAKRPEERPASGQALHELFQALLHDDSLVLDMPLSPGAHAATTEGMGGPAVMLGADNPERPLSGPEDWGGAQASPGPTSLSEGRAPTEPVERASPGSPRYLRRKWVAAASALGLLAALGVALWRGGELGSRPPVAPASQPPVSALEVLPPSPTVELSPALPLSDAGSPSPASLSPDAGPLTLAEAPPSSPLQKGPPMRTKPLAKNPTAPQAPEKLRSPSPSVANPLAMVAACALVGSCASSEPVMRLGPPPPQRCPPTSVEVMAKEFGIGTREFERMVTPFVMPGAGAKPRYEDSVPITEGRHAVRMYFGSSGPRGKGLPKKSVLVGDFIIRDKLYARFVEAELPDGRRFPFCGELLDPDTREVGAAFRPGSKQGEMMVGAILYVGSSDTDH